MGFNANNIKVGEIPEWMVENASPSITWDRHKELLEEHTKNLEKNFNQELTILKEHTKTLEKELNQKITKLNYQLNLKTSKTNFLEKKDKNSLTKDDLVFLISFIKEANFKGSQLENILQLTLKLQNQYTFLEKNNGKESQL